MVAVAPAKFVGVAKVFIEVTVGVEFVISPFKDVTPSVGRRARSTLSVPDPKLMNLLLPAEKKFIGIMKSGTTPYSVPKLEVPTRNGLFAESLAKLVRLSVFVTTAPISKETEWPERNCWPLEGVKNSMNCIVPSPFE